MPSKISYEKWISVNHLTIASKRTKTKTSFSDDKLKILHKELKSQKYLPKPSKRVEILKPDGNGTYPLCIPSRRDKIVQAAILIELEPILENFFLPSLFGFSPERNCHDVLHTIKYKWQNTTWLLFIDAQKYFGTTNYEILAKELHKYCDQATVEVITKLLKCGYVNLAANQIIDRQEKIILQESLLSPILSHLYMYTLDVFVKDHLLKMWNIGEEKKFVKGCRLKKTIHNINIALLEKYPKLNQATAKLKYNRWVSERSFTKVPKYLDFRRLSYVRYGNNFLLGFCGKKNEAIKIKKKIICFLQDDLNLEVNVEKSGIQHSSEKSIVFLGCYIRFYPNQITEYKVTQLKSQVVNNASLKAPINLLLERAVEKKYAVKKNNGNYRATSRRAIVGLSEKFIVDWYSSIICDILRYYSCVNQRSDLWPVVSLYKKSCALTLADKLNLRTAAQVFKKFGPKLSIKDVVGKKTTKLYYPKSLKTKIDFKKGQPAIDKFLCVYRNIIYSSYRGRHR